MTESFWDRLTRTPASRLRPGDQGIGVMDIGDGQPFGVAVTVLHVEQDGAVVQDLEGRTYKTPSLLAVGEDVDATLEAEEEHMAQEHDETRRAQYRARTQRSNET